MRNRSVLVLACLALAAGATGASGSAASAHGDLALAQARQIESENGNGTDKGGGEGDGDRRFERVLLISIDGLHQADLARFVGQSPTSTLARLSHQGVQYLNAHATTPSDSFPGLLALVTGGTPRSTGVYYDDSYDRTLYPPGSNCQPTRCR